MLYVTLDITYLHIRLNKGNRQANFVDFFDAARNVLRLKFEETLHALSALLDILQSNEDLKKVPSFKKPSSLNCFEKERLLNV
jgi:hypothetical protein